MDVFDPEKELGNLRASYGVARLLADDYNETRAERALASSAKAFVAGALRCILVGWYEPVEPLLRRAINWVTDAIRDREDSRRYEQYYTEGSRYRTLAMARWLLEGVHDEATCRATVTNFDAYYQQSGTLDKEAARLTLVDYLNASAYESALALHKKSGHKAPASARAASSEAAVSYILAQQRLTAPFSEADVAAALVRLFKANFQGPWLGRGHYDRAAVWMKVAFWKPAESPWQTVLRCYDFMPDLAAFRPSVAAPS